MEAMKKFILIIVLLATALAAQDQPNQLLEQAQREVATALEMLQLFPDRNAENLVRQAQSLLEEGRQLLNSRQPWLALSKLGMALDRARQAMEMLRKVPSQRSREEVEELLRRAEQLVSGSGNKEAERHLNSARFNLGKALHSSDRGQMQQSGEYLRLARFFLERALSLVETREPGQNSDLQADRSRFEELLELTREAVGRCEDPTARRLLLQAQQETEKIGALMQRGENKIVLTHYANGTRLLLRALDLCSGYEGTSREQLREEFSRLEEQIGRLLDRGEPAPSEAAPLRDKVHLIQMQVRHALETGQSGTALRKMELLRLLRRRLENPAPMAGNVQIELQRLLQELDEAERAAEKQTPRTRTLLRAAETQAEEAERHLQAGRIRPALAAIMAGNRLLTLAGGFPAAGSNYDAGIIRGELERLEERLQSMTLAEGLAPDAQEAVRQASRLCEMARQALQNNQLELAQEYIRLAREMAID